MNVVDEIKQKLDIVDIVSQYVKLQKSGRNFKANCPFHTEKTPSFFVFPDRQSWHCFGACGTGGDIFTFVMKKESMDFGQTLRSLAEKANVKLGPQTTQVSTEEKEKQDRLLKINEVAAEYFHYLLLHSPEAEPARQYAQKRGLSSITVQNFQLGFALPRWDSLLEHLKKLGYREDDILAAGLSVVRESGGYYDRFRNRLVFPIRDIKGRVIGFGGRALDDSLPKYINSPQTILFDKSSVLYGIDRARIAIKQKDSVVITEGYIDVIAAHQHGFENTLAPMGTALTDRQLSLIKQLTKNIVLALDADLAGIIASARSVEIIDDQIPLLSRVDLKNIEEYLQKEVKIAFIPQGKDLDQVVFETPDLWPKLLDDAKPIHDFILQKEIDKIKSDKKIDKSEIISKIIPVISKIRDKSKKGQYIEVFAHLLNINSRFLTDELFSYVKLESKSNINSLRKLLRHPVATYDSSRKLEEYCLALLLGFPDLRPISMKLSTDYFEQPENKDILLKWLENADIKAIIEKLDPAINDYFNYLLTFNQQLPPSLQQNKKERESALGDCLNRLQERYIKNLEIKKQMLLSEEVQTGDTDQQLAKLIEHGINESQQLKDIFKKRGRFFSRTKGA